MDFMEPISYPLKDLKKLIIGGLLVFPGMILLLIPLLIAIGYSIKVAGDTVRGRDELPEFDDWGYFLMKGLGYALVVIVYTIIIYIIIAIPFLLLYLGGVFTTGASSASIFWIVGLVLLTLASILVIMLMLMECMALVRYGEKENVGAAFAFGEIFRNFKANLGNYIVGFIILIALYIAVYIVVVIAMFTLIGIIFMGIILFYYILVEMRMFAQIYKESKMKLGG